MKRTQFLSLLTVGALAATALFAKVDNGAAAPAFSLTGHDGKTYNLADAKGKYVVVEWLNPGCPFVKKHYDNGDMQKLQKTYTGKGVVWYSIANDKSKLNPEKAAKFATDKGLGSTILIDSGNKVAASYGAKTTPHMFVINPEGKIIYQGAIDSINSTNSADVAKATNYVAQALEEAMAGKPVSKASSTPYGCGL